MSKNGENSNSTKKRKKIGVPTTQGSSSRSTASRSAAQSITQATINPRLRLAPQTQVLPTMPTAQGPAYLGTYQPKTVPVPAPAPIKKEDSFSIDVKDFKESNLSVDQYFLGLVKKYRKFADNSNDTVEHQQQQIKQFYVYSFELINDESPDALTSLHELITAAKSKGVQFSKPEVKEATQNKINAIKNEQRNNPNATFYNPTPKLTPQETKRSKPIISSATSFISPKVAYVAHAFQAEIDRLTGKLTHFILKYFTWNKEMVQEKIEALETIKQFIELDENKVDIVINKINDNTEEQDDITSSPALLNYYKIKQHRQGYFGSSTTQSNLQDAFKNMPRIYF